MSRTWSKADERGLARFVLPEESARNIRLPRASPDASAGINALLVTERDIYRALQRKDLRYVPEVYDPDERIQLVRSPAEVLDPSGPGEGTCLDLSLVFCGIALAMDLLPVLVILEGHALVAISLTHPGRGWQSSD